MKAYKKILLAVPVALGSALLLSLDVAMAGLERSPFQPEINQLGAAENILDSAGGRIVRSMDQNDDPGAPGPNLNGALNRLEAIDGQLGSVDNMVASMIAEVMGTEPSRFLPDIVPALAGVNGAALNIVDEIEARLGFEPMPFVPEYATALGTVQDSAQTIVTNTQQYIDQIECDVICPEIETADMCNSYVCCVWIPTTDNPDGDGWCDYDPDFPPGD